MKKLPIAALAAAFALAACQPEAPAPAPSPAATPATPVKTADELFADKLDGALAGDWRSVENRARDAHRHPKETLMFFGLAPGMRVVEITPGGGWYTEILGPLLMGEGELVAAIANPAGLENQRLVDYLTRSNQAFRDKLAADPERYGEVQVLEFPVQEPNFGESASADMVLTFRNVHNWTMWGTDAAMFRAFFDVLKPGGVLGVVEHRAAPGTDAATSADTGYIAQDYVVKLATDAGFELAAESEANANPADTRDHANGVWTLPPSLRVPEGEDKAKYEAIGESDRMTLKFVKPAAAAATSSSFESDAEGSGEAPPAEGSGG